MSYPRYPRKKCFKQMNVSEAVCWHVQKSFNWRNVRSPVTIHVAWLDIFLPSDFSEARKTPIPKKDSVHGPEHDISERITMCPRIAVRKLHVSSRMHCELPVEIWFVIYRPPVVWSTPSPRHAEDFLGILARHAPASYASLLSSAEPPEIHTVTNISMGDTTFQLIFTT